MVEISAKTTERRLPQQGGEVFEGIQGGLGGGADVEVGGLFGEVGRLGHLGALSRGAGEAAWKRKGEC